MHALIGTLVADAAPVRRLRHPMLRWVSWLGVAVIVAATLFWGHGLRDDLIECLGELHFVTGTIAAIATGLTAGIGALMAAMPDRSPRWLWLPVPAATVWVAGTTGGCLWNWVETDFSMVTADALLDCLGLLIATAVPLLVAQVLLLGPISRVAPRGTLAVFCLATAGMVAGLHNLTHAFETSALVLIWSVGAGALVFLLDWIAARSAARLYPAR